MRSVVIMGAGGRDFHTFNTLFRDDADARVVAFTATQIPGIDDRTYPASLAGPHYPDGVPILPEASLEPLLRDERVDEVIHAYSDVSHAEVMHVASRVLAAGADFRLVGPRASVLQARKPVVAVCAVRTGCGKSQTSRRVAEILRDAGLGAVLVRHPMPYGDLAAMRVQRFGSLADIDAADPTVEEREEYEAPVRQGLAVYAGVDYAAILDRAEAEADVIIWDGGNNDLPFFAPDVHIVVADALRPGHETAYHPGEANLRLADAVVVNKVDVASAEAVEHIRASVRSANPSATLVLAESPARLDPGPRLEGARVLVVEDGPTITHGGMPYGAGVVAARQAGAEVLVDPRAWAVGSLAETYARYHDIGAVLPAMGYSPAQLDDLQATIAAVACDAVVVGTPIDLARVIAIPHPVRRATYRLQEVGRPDLTDVLAPLLDAVPAGVAGERTS